jgi:hypothetical protein
MDAVFQFTSSMFAMPCPLVMQVEMSSYLKNDLQVQQLVANGNDGFRSRGVFDPNAPKADVRAHGPFFENPCIRPALHACQTVCS